MKKILFALLIVVLFTGTVFSDTLPYKKPSPLNISGDTVEITKNRSIEIGGGSSNLLKLTGSVSILGANDVEVIGECAYVTQTGNNLTSAVSAVDISIKSAPVVVATLPRNEILPYPHSIVRMGNYLFVTNLGSSSRASELSIAAIKTTKGCQMAVVDTYYDSTYQGAYDIDIMGSTLVLTTADATNDAVIALDVANPEDIKLYSVLQDSTNLNKTYGIECHNGYCIVLSDTGNTIASLDVTDPKNMKVIDVIGSWDGLSDYLYCNESLCYLSDYSNDKFGIINIKDPYNIALLSGTLTDATNLNGCNAIIKFNDYAVCASEAGARITFINVLTPTAPVVKASFTDSTYIEMAHALELDGEYLIQTDTRDNVGNGKNLLNIWKMPSIDALSGRISSLSSDNINSGDVNTRNLNVHQSTTMHDVAITGKLSANGFSVSNSNLNDYTASTSFLTADGDGTGIMDFVVMNNILYAAQIGGVGVANELDSCCNNTAGSVWTAFAATAVGAELGFNKLGVFNDKLYMGTGNTNDLAYLRVCDVDAANGVTTICDNDTDITASFLFSDAGNPDNCGVGSPSYNAIYALGNYKSKLYAGMGNAACEGDIWVCGSPTGDCDTLAEFALSYNGAAHTTDTINRTVNDFEIFRGVFYVAFRSDVAADNYKILYCDDDADTDDNLCKDGTSAEWLPAHGIAGTEVFESSKEVKDLQTYNGKLYASTGTNTSLLYACDPSGGGTATLCDNDSDWTQVAEAEGGTFTDISVLAVWQDMLIVGTTGAAGDANVYVYTGNVGTLDQASVTNLASLFDPGAAYESINTLEVYKGDLYIGVGSSAGDADIFVIEGSTGKVTQYAGDSVSGAGMASIVNYLASTDNAADISTTNLFIPPIDGLYRLTLYAVCSTAGGGADAISAFTVGWTDVTGTARTLDLISANQNHQAAATLDCTATNYINTFPVTINALSRAPITYATTGVYAGGGKADFYVTVERLK